MVSIIIVVLWIPVFIERGGSNGFRRLPVVTQQKVKRLVLHITLNKISRAKFRKTSKYCKFCQADCCILH